MELDLIFLTLIADYFEKSWSGFLIFLVNNKTVFVNITYFILFTGVIQSVIYISQIPLAALELYKLQLRDKDNHKWWLSRSDITLPISVFIPAYNEGTHIVNNVRSTLSLNYSTYEVIVVNDGSTDDTLSKLIDEFSLELSQHAYEMQIDCKEIRGVYKSSIYDHLIVIDKGNGGKSDALNAAINMSRYPIFCTMDADSLLDADALITIIQPFIEYPEEAIAVGGIIRIVNGCDIKNGFVYDFGLPKSFTQLVQIVEYLRSFLMGRLALNKLETTILISGAFTVLQRQAVIDIGGFNTNTVGEDYDLILSLHYYMLKNKRKYKITFLPDTICWTEAPNDFKTLRSQRIRWHQGAVTGFFHHIKMFLNPRYKRVGLIAFPHIFIMDILGPLTEFMGYILIPSFYILGIIDLEILLAFTALVFLVGTFISFMSLILEDLYLRKYKKPLDILTLAIVAIFENFGYRQLNNYWRVLGWIRFIFNENIWGDMKRNGTIKNSPSKVEVIKAKT